MAFDFGIKTLKSGFFDADAILKQMDALTRRTLSRFGAFVRTRMRTSIKYAKGKSSPGKPPHAHTRVKFTRLKKNRKTGESKAQRVSPLRELIFFSYDPQAQSVVAGPVKFGNAGAPGRLERGGPGTFTDSNTGEPKRAVWKPRPFAKPAGDAEVKRFPQTMRG